MKSVHYELRDQVATIRIDDGKRNALSPDVLREIYAALDRAEADRALVILTGRESVFSAGFDLHVMKRGGPNALRMLRLGYALTARVMAYPYPGHRRLQRPRAGDGRVPDAVGRLCRSAAAATSRSRPTRSPSA